MSIYFLTTALLIVSILTNVTVEGLKKLFDGSGKSYSSNSLAAITAVIISVVVCVVYIIMHDITFTLKVGVEVFILMYLSFLASTVGYDKVVQMITQIQNVKGR